MKPHLSDVGNRMSSLTGVRAIMKDIQETLRSAKDKTFINLSPGNPLVLPVVEAMWRELTAELLASKDFGTVVCRYGASQGYEPLIESIRDDFNRRFGIALESKNILITPGSQSLFFFGANAFAGQEAERGHRRVLLPLCPDYTGYGGIALDSTTVVSSKPDLDIDAAHHHFKYRPNFSRIHVTDDIGCVIFSRPSNPTGNVLTGDEVRRIVALAAPKNIPVMIDSAYAPPYPALNFTELEPVFGPNVIHCMSLSKAGLPGERIGVAIGDPDYLLPLEAFQSNACIHASRYGQAIAALAIRSGRLAEVATSVIRPFYQQKLAILEAAAEKYISPNIPYYLHRGEGGLFSWIWMDGLPISDRELYALLKAEGLLVVPGSSFFPGLQEEWKHSTECMRISLTGSDQELTRAMEIFGLVLSRLEWK